MEHVMDSEFYKEYIEHVTAEVTLDLVAKVIQCREKKIGGETTVSTRNRPCTPKLDDAQEADLADVRADLDALGFQKRILEQKLVRAMAEFPHPPRGLIERLSIREPSRWGLKHIVGLITRCIHSLQRKGRGRSEEREIKYIDGFTYDVDPRMRGYIEYDAYVWPGFRRVF